MEKSFLVSIRRLEQQLKEVNSERDVFEKEMNTYAMENKALKEQISKLHSLHNADDSKAMGVLKDIQNQHQHINDLYKIELKEKERKIEELQGSVQQLNTDLEKHKISDKENKSLPLKYDNKIATLQEKLVNLEKQSREKEKQLNAKLKSEDENVKVSSQQRVRIRVMEDQLKSLRSENERINNELAKVKIKFTSDHNKKDSELLKYESEVKSLHDQVKILQSDVKEKSDLYNSAARELSSLKGNTDTAASKNRVQQKVFEDKLSRLKEELKEKEAQISSLNKQSTREQHERSTLTSHHQSELLILKKQITNLQQDCKSKDIDLVKALKQVERLEVGQTSASAKHDITIRALEDEIAKLKQQLHGKDGEICSLNNKVLSLEKKDDKVSSKYTLQLDRLKEEIDHLTKDSSLKDRKLSKSQKEIERLKSENDSFETRHQFKLRSLEKEIASLKTENREKEVQLCRVTSKLSSFESQSESTSVKQQIHLQAMEEKVNRLERELKRKSEELCSASNKLNSQEMDAETLLSQQRSQQRALESKIKKLETENKNKEMELCKISSKLGQSELDVDSVASSYRIQLCALEDKVDRLQSENQNKEKELISVQSQASDKDRQIHVLKEKTRRLEMEMKRKEENLLQLQSTEEERASISSANSTEVQLLQREKRKLESKCSSLQSKLSNAECELTDLKESHTRTTTLLEMNLEDEKHRKNKFATTKEKIEKELHSQIQALKCTNLQMKTDLEQSKNLKTNLIKTVEELSEKLKSEEKKRKNLEEISSETSLKIQKTDTEKQRQILEQQRTIQQHNTEMDELKKQLSHLQDEKTELEKKYEDMEMDLSLHSSVEMQLSNYKEKFNHLQAANGKLIKQHESLMNEHRELSRKLESKESAYNNQSAQVFEHEKMIGVLKESCLMLEKQVEDLESFNNNLIEKQNKIALERDEALKKSSVLQRELLSSKHQLKAELSSLDQCSTDQITELKIQLRNEMNEAHELAEQHRDLERRYKNLELSAVALQRKLNAEKKSHEMCLNELNRIRANMEVLQQSSRRAEQNLHSEVDRYDMLEREKTQLLNRMETEKLEYSHDLIRLNCQGAQQTKLIDFLQSRVEELEPSDKKKKKKKTTLYQAPLQYRELCDLLEEEKASNVRLQEQVNMLRSELQASNSKVKRMKHGMDAPLSPGSIAAISAIVKSPAAGADGALSPKGGKLRSKPRMQHNIPHRLSNWVCHRAMRCSVCMSSIHFGHTAQRCSECSVVCHAKCRKSITNTCGLPGGLFQQFKEGPKSSNLSPISCVFKGSNSDQMHGRLKVLCGDDVWSSRSVRISSNQLRIGRLDAKSPSKLSDKDDIIDLTQAAYIYTDLTQCELPNTAKLDLSYAFKIQTGSTSSCWPARSVYFLAAGYAEKHTWVEKLESIVAQHSGRKVISNNAKIFGNEILTLLSDEKLEMNCSLPVSEKSILFGCDEGLFILSPHTDKVSSKADMRRVEGVSGLFQMIPLNKTKILAIEGTKHRLISFDSSMIQNYKVSIQCIEDMEGCHLFAVGRAEGVYHLCVASATNITLLKYNEKLKKFCKKKEIATSEPCTCMVFTACSVIIGTNAFYEVDLRDFKIDEFVDNDLTVATTSNDGSVFPVSVLKIKERNGRQEFLLCYHEYGLFVDGFGHQTRTGQIRWSRMPLSFEYREPYLIVIQFNSVEIVRLDVEGGSSADNSKLDHAFLSFPSARYLGPAITQGAVYLSSNQGNRTSVFCCKGNMNENLQKPNKSALPNKRHYASLSSSADSLSSPTTKRSTKFTDVSDVSSNKSKNLSASSQSMESDTSRWTTPTAEADDTSYSSIITRISESDNMSSGYEESMRSDASCLSETTKLQWRPAKSVPAKPARTRKPLNDFASVPSTQV